MKSSTHVISQKTFGSDVFHLNKHNYVGKTILLQNYFCLKTKNYVEGLCNQIHLTCLLKHHIKFLKIAPKLIQNLL